MQWKDISLIVDSLEENYSDVEIDDLTYPELYDLILDLSDFSDDPEEVNDQKLESIKEAWIEYRKEN